MLREQLKALGGGWGIEIAAGGSCSISRRFKMETTNREHIRVYIGVMEKENGSCCLRSSSSDSLLLGSRI